HSPPCRTSHTVPAHHTFPPPPVHSSKYCSSTRCDSLLPPEPPCTTAQTPAAPSSHTTHTPPPQTSSPHSPDNRPCPPDSALQPTSMARAARSYRETPPSHPPAGALSHRQQTSRSNTPSSRIPRHRQIPDTGDSSPHTGPHKTPADCKAQPFPQTRCSPPSRRPAHTAFHPAPYDPHPKQNSSP